MLFAGRRLAVLVTPPHRFGAEGGTVSTLATSRLGHYRRSSAWSEQLTDERTSSAWKAEAPAAIPRRSWREMKDSNPRNWDLEASVLGRYGGANGDDNGAILPIDHSSGSLPWT